MVSSGLRPADSTPIGSICKSHQQAFFNVARGLKVWILVRATNKSSIKYIGPGFPDIIPKPKSCDAKTADEGALAGLVVCPRIVRSAFSPERYLEAMETWEKWAPEWLPVQFERDYLDRSGGQQLRSDFDDGRFNKAGLPLHYGVIEDPDSKYHGCVVNFQSGSPKMMHGDYDLYDVVDPNSPHDQQKFELEFNGSLSIYGPKTKKVQETLNSLISDGNVSTAMIQHGEHMAKFEHKEDMIFVFSPHPGDGLIIVYPFAFGLESIRALYRRIFDNRRG